VSTAAVTTDAASVRHRYHGLRVKRVVRETADACSIVFDIPSDLAEQYRYRAGQFVTVHAVLDGEPYARSYSMSSSPDVDADLQVTVKRVPDGIVSNWLNDTVATDAVLDIAPPGGSFVLGDTADDLVAFAAGSGITPVISIVKTALHTTDRRVRLLYANRDRESTIFADALDALAAEAPDRLQIDHHFDVDRGFIDAAEVAAFLGEQRDGQFYICGPGPFMDTVEATLRDLGVAADRVHIERFTPADPAGAESDAPPDEIEITARLGTKSVTVAHRAGLTVLQSVRSAGLRAPSSCEQGNCATCMARLVEGEVEMRINDVLTPDEVDEGWILTCQAVPLTSRVDVVYE
jgi:ferredoxin-NADP reductase